MGEKSLQKKKYILEKAREVFMEKGYKNVTMKDIVDACEISRGGLYLYFPGTRELFLEVLKAEQEDSGSEFEQKIGKDFGPADILALFLKEQKRELLTKKGTLQKACYEFFFEENDYSRENLLKNIPQSFRRSTSQSCHRKKFCLIMPTIIPEKQTPSADYCIFKSSS